MRTLGVCFATACWRVVGDEKDGEGMVEDGKEEKVGKGLIDRSRYITITFFIKKGKKTEEKKREKKRRKKRRRSEKE